MILSGQLSNGGCMQKEVIIESLAIFGFLVSAYGWYIEKKLQKDASYKPFCDISDKLSCIKATKSPYSHLLFVSNSVVAMVFYATVFCLALIGFSFLIQMLSIAAFATSTVMAYILFYKIKTACPVCITLYVINTLLFLFSALF